MSDKFRILISTHTCKSKLEPFLNVRTACRRVNVQNMIEKRSDIFQWKIQLT